MVKASKEIGIPDCGLTLVGDLRMGSENILFSGDFAS
jgi:hypothetical protein